MGLFKNSNGIVQETPNADDVTTQVLDRQKQNTIQSDNGDVPTDLIQDEPPTVNNPSEPPTETSSSINDPTILSIPKKREPNDTIADKFPKKDTSNGMDDPVVGWVVIIKGAGQGYSRKLGYGQNTIGRSHTERVSLDFGVNSDSEISRVKHAVITYDPKGKKYYLYSGDGINLTYLNDAPVLTPVELTGGEKIVLGDTTLYFVPFCGEKFDWQTNN
ncbi:MAG: FHA domain-containing protein [Thiomargarita sp.]|nr:FHA domain-containing protein [Thiomargarita sp.]